MSAAGDMRRGWCPGALRPMRTGGGLIVRLRLSCGVLPSDLAREIASWAGRFGNGQIELSARGNLQLRGVSEATLPALTGAMADAGLLDASPEAEAVRNVLASPLAGIDPAARDIRGLASALEGMLAGVPELHRLPAKFSWIVDGGGALPLDRMEADVRFRTDGDRFAVGLQRVDGIAWLDGVEAHQVVPRAVEIARWFLSLGTRRMRDVPEASLPQRQGIGRVLPDACRPFGAKAGAVTGGGTVVATLAGLPFGRTDAAGLLRLAGIAGGHEMRLTPFRAIAIPGEVAGLAAAGFITDPADPRLAIEACPGAPACASASTATLVDAGRIARHLAPGTRLSIHVSGCEKGCAHPGPADITLVAREGRYGLVRGGTARDKTSTWLPPDELTGVLP